jgi:hypothetical protein
MVRAGAVVTAQKISAVFALVAVVPVFPARPFLSNLIYLRLNFALGFFEAITLIVLFVSLHRWILLRAHETALGVAYLFVGVFYKKKV